jgi:hypothetical protein
MQTLRRTVSNCLIPLKKELDLDQIALDWYRILAQ